MVAFVLPCYTKPIAYIRLKNWRCSQTEQSQPYTIKPQCLDSKAPADRTVKPWQRRGWQNLDSYSETDKVSQHGTMYCPRRKRSSVTNRCEPETSASFYAMVLRIAGQCASAAHVTERGGASEFVSFSWTRASHRRRICSPSWPLRQIELFC